MAGLFDQDWIDSLLRDPNLPPELRKQLERRPRDPEDQMLSPMEPLQAPPGTSFMPPPPAQSRFPLQESPPFDPNAKRQPLGTPQPGMTAPPGSSFVPPGGYDPGNPMSPASPLYQPRAPMQQASMTGGMPMGIGPMAQAGAGGGGGGILGALGLGGGGNGQAATGGRPWGPMLMALGGGIAGGATQGWGAGIGAGLTGAAAIRQNQAELDMRQKAYDLQLQNAKTEQERWASQFGLQERTLNLTAQDRADRLREKQEVRFDKEQKLTGPINQIASVADQYPTIRKTLTENDSMASWSRAATLEGSPFGGGEVGRSLRLLKTAIYGAANINGDNPELTWENMKPTGPADADEKLRAIESYITGVGGGLSGNETQAKSLAKFSKFTSPEPAPDQNAQTTGQVEAGAGGGGQSAPKITTSDEWRKLPVGATYIGPDGKMRRKGVE